jgi:hypothetical protein
MAASVLSMQQWESRPDAYHQHAALHPLGGRAVFLVHRHDLGDTSHQHAEVESGAAGAHATDVADITPADDMGVPDAVRYRPCDFVRDMRGARRRHAELEAML